MKLYCHYKNNPYKFIGVAKSTEDLKDFVIYETRYENDLAKVWARPKDMFFEEIEFNGEKVPRFREIPLEIHASMNLSASDMNIIAVMSEQIFGKWDPAWFQRKAKTHKKFFLLAAKIEGELAGFKLGYEMDRKTFYSWIGGVLNEYRGLGIASDLMNAQHEWCRKKGYAWVQTKSQNRFREMLILNLKHGFNVVGTQNSGEGGPKILLEKKLT